MIEYENLKNNNKSYFKESDLLKSGYLSYLGAIASIIILPLHVQYLPPFMILWALGWLLESFHSLKITTASKSLKILFGLFILYYIWQLIGLTYSSDIKLGLSNLFGRLSLLLFPLLLVFPGPMVKSKIRSLLNTFAVSTLFFIFICFCYALIRSLNIINGGLIYNPHPIEASWLNYFYSAELTITQHPTYIAMYVLLSSFISFEAWFANSSGSKMRILWLISGGILVVSQYFLSSRAGILSTMILLPLYFLLKFRKTGKSKFAWIWIVIIIIVAIPVVLKNQRVDYLYSKVLNNKTDYDRKDDPRFKIWDSSFKIARENLLFGVGIGDVRASLAAEYKKIGEENMAKERLNAHNQFIEVFVENGLIGLIIFISVFGYMFYLAYLNKNTLYMLFILISILFFMFETMLYRLAGVSFFSLFSFLTYYDKYGIESNETEVQTH
jgi:O-antigen ligase